MKTVVKLLTDLKHIKRGSSTVFLALVFTVIIMLITAVCSLLCYRAEKTNIKRGLNIAMESEFGKFYRPLFDDYRLLYYIDVNENILAADILSYFMVNQNDMPELLKLTPSGFDIVEKSYAVDNKCSNVMKQMTEGIVYTLGEDTIDKLRGKIKDRLGLFEENDKVLDTVSDDSSNIEEDAYVQERVLRLLRLVEGIYIKNGEIKCEKLYVKQGVTEDISETSSGIDSPDVWEAVKANKWNVSVELKKLKENNIPVSDNRFKKFIKKIEELYEITQKAYELAADIDRDISDRIRSDCICDIHGMKGKLYDNLNILKSIAKSQSGAGECMEMLKGYHVRDMYFDYSTLSLKKEKNPVEKLDMNSSDIINFLLEDETDISSSCIKETGIYEKISKEYGKEENEKDEYPDFRKTEEISEYVDSCKSGVSMHGIDDLIYLNLYVNKYFDDFTNKDEDNKPRALSYEKEYIICGKKSDRENLKSVINSLLLMRTGVSFVYLVSDKEKSGLAYATAAAIVGFTGMDALVRCTQYIILAGWAYEDACVDVSALLHGKKIQCLKKKRDFNIEYHEIVLFGKDMISQKVHEMDSESGIGYSDFLCLFMNMKDIKNCLYRSMDIIHYNMKLRYSGLFSFQNALYKAKAHIECSRPYFCETDAEYYYK